MKKIIAPIFLCAALAVNAQEPAPAETPAPAPAAEAAPAPAEAPTPVAPAAEPLPELPPRQEPQMDLATAVLQAGSYEFGQSRKALIFIEEAALAANGNADAAADIERVMLQLLKDEKSTADAKRFAIRMLQISGTAVSIEPLGALVTKPEYNGHALQALESLAYKFPNEVDAVLSREAFNASPEMAANFIGCMGRYEGPALVNMTQFLDHESPMVRNAMASSLGKLGDAGGCSKLQEHLRNSNMDPAPLWDGCINCIPVLAASTSVEVLNLVEALTAPTAPAYVRAQAYKEAVKLAPYTEAEPEARRVALLQSAEADADPEMVRARIEVLEENPDAAASLVALLDNPEPAVQVMALGALQRRGDAPAGVVAGKLQSESADVRAAAVNALIASNSDEAIDPLMALAASDSADARRTAVDALTRINAPGANAKLIAVVQSGTPEQQAAALELLGQRRATEAHDAVLAAAASTDATVFDAAHAALSVLAVEGDLAGLLDNALNLSDEGRAKEYQNTAVALAERLPDGQRTGMLSERLAAATDAPVRATILGMMGRVGGQQALDALTAATQDADLGVRVAAAKALGDWTNADALPALAEMLKGDTADEATQEAYDGLVKLMRVAELPSNVGINYVQVLRKAADSDADNRKLLQALATVTDLRAFRIAEGLSRQESMKNDAEQTLVDLGKRLAGAYPRPIQGRMVQIARTTKNDTIKGAATAVSNAINTFDTYLTSWVSSGPYKLDGKRANELYDVRFAPEDGLKCGDPVTTGHLGWEILPAGVTPEMPGYVDLQEEYFENECVAFARTCIEVATAQVGRLEVGSDDGCRVWFNGELKIDNLGMRHYVPGEDIALLDLKPGKHSIVVAVYNHASNWGFSAKLTDQAGNAINTLDVLDPK